MNTQKDHVTVCICTYKRPVLLRRLIEHLLSQSVDRSLTFSVLVVDNDSRQSARDTVLAFQKQDVSIEYHCEPEQNIALARNRALENAHGSYIAFLDDDEFPVHAWLQSLVSASRQYGADGVLGPVKPHFESQPPQWVLKGKLCDRETYPTGTILTRPKDTRTGNVLFTVDVFADASARFDPRFGLSGGEDVDLFKRLMEKGRKFVWCNEASVYESVPPERTTRSYFLKRALLRGVVSSRRGRLDINSALRSMMAIPLYTSALPFLLLAGHHHFIKYLAKDCLHLGRFFGMLGIDLIQVKKL